MARSDNSCSICQLACSRSFGQRKLQTRNGSKLEAAMHVNLSIKNAPDELVGRLKGRAERHHRPVSPTVAPPPWEYFRDAQDLWLARRLESELVTLDEGLSKVERRSN
jgi:hypothetical protein